jgi:choline dehydrogenase-like flavoprotein
MGQCTYCGYCEWFGCGNYSKSSPQTTILPVLVRKSNFEARTESEVPRINLDNTGKRATSVTTARIDPPELTRDDASTGRVRGRERGLGLHQPAAFRVQTPKAGRRSH